MKKLLVFVIFFVLCVFVGSPYIRLYQINQFYNNQDANSFSEKIDYETLSLNLKKQLHQRFQIRLEKNPLLTQIGGSSLINAGEELINTSVDKAITPENMKQTLYDQTQITSENKKLMFTWALASGKIDVQQLLQSMVLTQGNIQKTSEEQVALIKKSIQQVHSEADGIDLSYCGLNCFSVKLVQEGLPLEVMLERSNIIDWRVVNIVLP